MLTGAVVVLAATWLLAGAARTDPLALAVLVVFAAAAQARPLHLSPKMKIGVDDTPIFAIALLFEPAYAATGAAVAMLASRVGRDDPWYGHAFNTAAAVLAVAASSATSEDTSGSHHAVHVFHKVDAAVA